MKFIQPIFDIMVDDQEKNIQNFYQMIKYDDDEKYHDNDHLKDKFLKKDKLMENGKKLPKKYIII